MERDKRLFYIGHSQQLEVESSENNDIAAEVGIKYYIRILRAALQ